MAVLVPLFLLALLLGCYSGARGGKMRHHDGEGLEAGGGAVMMGGVAVASGCRGGGGG